MKLEDQITSLELSKKLKNLGVEQESLFYWQLFNNGADLTYSGSYEGNSLNQLKATSISAFTVAELGEMLKLDEIEIRTERGVSGDWYLSMEAGGGGVQFVANTEVNARAKMLIYLIENKLFSLE